MRWARLVAGLSVAFASLVKPLPPAEAAERAEGTHVGKRLYVDAGPPAVDFARDAVKRYYETQGEFRGQYALASVEAIRFERVDDTLYDAHVRYRFECLHARCCCGANGFDQRTFRFRFTSTSGFEVIAMGGHMSARFD